MVENFYKKLERILRIHFVILNLVVLTSRFNIVDDVILLYLHKGMLGEDIHDQHGIHHTFVTFQSSNVSMSSCAQEATTTISTSLG